MEISSGVVSGYGYSPGKEGFQLAMGLLEFNIKHILSRIYPHLLRKCHVIFIMQEGCGFQPRGANSHVYQLSSTHSLVGTAEIPLACMFYSLGVCIFISVDASMRTSVKQEALSTQDTIRGHSRLASQGNSAIEL